MTQTNTNTNTNNGQNRNQIFERGGQGRSPGDRGRGNCRNNCRNNSIANKYSFEGKLKDGPISKLIIAETGHRPTQYKKVIDTLPILCTDKNYQSLDDAIWNRIDLVEADFTPPYLDVDQWSTTHHVKNITVNPTNALDVVTGERPPTQQTIITVQNPKNTPYIHQTCTVHALYKAVN